MALLRPSVRCPTFSKPYGSATTGPTSMKLGLYILWVGDKTSRKRNFKVRPLRSAGKMTHPEQCACIFNLFIRPSVCPSIRSFVNTIC